MTTPRVIVTRPAREAQQWVRQLQARGLDAAALPLIDIRACEKPNAPVLALSRYRALMFVSGNAVQHFFRTFPAQTLAWKAQAAIPLRAWSPGPGTTQALIEAGVAPHAIDSPAADAAQFDSEALWRRVGVQVRPDDTVLIVRGGAGDAPAGSGRDWLAQQIAAAGGHAEFLCVYERGAPTLDASQKALALQAGSDGSVWLFSSSEAVRHLGAALPDQSWHAASALATHPRIAQAALAAGFGRVRLCRPTLEDVVASIESPA